MRNALFGSVSLLFLFATPACDVEQTDFDEALEASPRGDAVQAVEGEVPISPTLYGQNLFTPLSSEVWDMATRSGVRLIRMGGIGFDDDIPNHSTLLSWVDDIRDAGAEPMVQVSRKDGAASAAAIVRFLNVANGRKVRFWEIGNEPDREWTGTQEQKAASVAGYLKAISVAMRDVDPTIQLYGPGPTWPDPVYYTRWLGGEQDITGKDKKGRFFLNGFTFHSYPFKDNGTRDSVLSRLHTWPKRLAALTSRIAYANDLHGRTGENALGFGISEFNISYYNAVPNDIEGVGTNSFLNGQFFAEYFALGMRYRAKFLNSWSFWEGGTHTNPRDLGYLDGPATSPVPRSSYYHFQLMTRHFTGRSLESRSTAVNVPAVAARSGSQIAVMLLNEDLFAHSYAVRLNEDAIAGAADTKITVSAGLARQVAGSIADQTTLVLIFDLTGKLTKRIRYSIRHNLNGLPPIENPVP